MGRELTTGTYCVKEAANILGVTPVTIIRWIRSGHLKASRLGRVYRVRYEALEHFIDRNQVKTKHG